ncbi:hypothetical protein MMC31_007935 [Peltigera leucophlebia]|nr:hypothetical protein [Peltigera leucophlebia]
MILPLLQILTLTLFLVSSLAQQGTYDGYSTSTLIPFLQTEDSGVPFTNPVSIALRFSSTSSREFTPIVDTGTCGYVVSAADIPDWREEEATFDSLGWEFLSSSKKLYNGHWIKRDIFFNVGSSTNPLIRSQVPVLAVTNVTICNDYNVAVDKDKCPTIPAPPVEHNPRGIDLFGIGYGRVADGQPQGTPDKNPILNVVDIAGPDNSLASLWPGYIISKAGITIGLTNTNTAGMEFALLPPRTKTPTEDATTPRHPFDWAQLPGCVSVDGALPCTKCTVIHDTGVDQAYITVPLSVTLRRLSGSFILVTGSDVQITFGQPGIASESFVVGTGVTTGVTPREVFGYRTSRRAPRVNTGSHVYRAFEVGFDAVRGRLGFKAIEKNDLKKSQGNQFVYTGL